MSPFFNHVAVAYVRRSDSPSRSEIQALTGHRVDLQEWSASSSPVRLIALTKRLVDAFRSGNYDAFHLHSSRAGFLGRLVARLLRRTHITAYSPHFFAFAQDGLEARKRTALLFLERTAANWGNKLVVVSPSESAQARAALPGVVVAVLPNAVDNDALGVRARSAARSTQGALQPPNARSYTVVHVGRIAEQKCPEVFRAAIDVLYDLFPPGGVINVKASWLGDGKRTLLGQASRPIEVSGWLSPETLHKRLAGADVVLFTSRGEGMPLALLEAQALGLPIVASRVNGVVDVVEHAHTGFLGSTPGELAGYVSQLLTDDGLRGRMALAARHRSKLSFDVGGLAQRSIDVYRSLEIGPGAAP